ncbi:MAG: MtrB/PioB family decaheme-associated outer membrane protein, partial [Candidatus Poribacteria bacterium]
YGKFKLNLIYDQLPHRFAYNAKTFYSGIGSGNMTLADGMQKDLQDSVTKAKTDINGDGKIDATDDTTASSINLADTLKKDYFPSAFLTDLQLFRKTGKANIEVTALDPFNLKVELSREKREGTRPFFGAFGFGTAIEIPEPIDYDTTALNFSAEYAKKPVYLSISNYTSIFDNNIDTLAWDNPARITDSTAANAYSSSYAAGPSKALMDLYPNNKYNNTSAMGAIDLPLKSRLSATASLGVMMQDDALLPYTTNTAIKTGAVTGVDKVLVPFNAWEIANLPTDKVDAKVNTSLVNVLFTSKPQKLIRVKARYRLYERNDKTEEITFPGFARTDAVWEPEHLANFPVGYKKSTANINVGFEVFKETVLTAGYTLDQMKRTHREVAESDDNIFKVSLDAKPIPSLLDFRVSYEKSKREGEYDFKVPFEDEAEPPQLPLLRKYDEANRDRDRFQGILSVYPIESLTLTGQVIYGKDNFIDSAFGLLDDKHNIYSIDADYQLIDKLSLFGFFSQEKYNNSQKARQWTPAALGDPYTKEPGIDSPSNWEADNEDKVNTFGGGLDCEILPKILNFNLSYSQSKTDGGIVISSPVGGKDAKGVVIDANNFEPIPFTQVDDTKLHLLNAKLNYQIDGGPSITVGYMLEKFDIKDFLINLEESGVDYFSEDEGYIPTTPVGGYNAAVLMGTLTKGYNANVVYVTIGYRF